MAPRYTDYRPGPQYGPRTLRDVAGGGDEYTRILFAGADAQARAALQSGDAWANAIGGLGQIAVDYGHQRDQKKADEAARLATSPEYPSATKPVPGSEFDKTDPGMNHIDAIMSRVTPEMRPQVEEKIKTVQASRQKVLEQQQKLQQETADHMFVTASELEPHMKDADGGISAFNAAVTLSNGVPGAEQYAQFGQDAAKAYAQAPDEQSKAAVADAFRQQAGPLIQKGKAGGSMAAQTSYANLLKTRAETAKLNQPVVKEPKQETRSVEVQMADALSRGDEEAYQRLVKVQKDFASAGRDPEAAANRAAAAAARNDARFDAQTNHSYEYNDKKLEARAKPLMDQAARFDRLVTTVNEKTAQGDALVAPELLTVMAGGSGSGLRINEAEISRLVGGRSHWANLQAAVQKWVPGQALSITDDQRKEIQKLLSNLGERISAKNKIIEDARGALIDAKDITAHRRILADMESKLNAVGKTENAAPGEPRLVNSPAEARKLPSGTLYKTPDGRTFRAP